MLSCVKVGINVNNERVKVYTSGGEKKNCENDSILRVISEKILATNKLSKDGCALQAQLLLLSISYLLVPCSKGL